MARDMRSEGHGEEAAQWEAWADLIEHGRDMEAQGLGDLRALNRAAKWVEREIYGNVAALRSIGTSWARIGLQLGISDEGARKKFRGIAEKAG